MPSEFSQYFVYIHQKKTIFLNPAKKLKLFKGEVNGDLCIEESTYDLELELVSDILPSSKYSVEVLVQPLDSDER